jgi:hypothetical protein
MADLTPAQLLAATATDMRALADSPATAAAPWSARFGEIHDRAGLHIAEIDTVTHAGALGDQRNRSTVEHVAAWDPDMARAVADWLDAKAVRYSDRAWATRLLGDIAAGASPPMLRVCDAWWASRGLEPQAVDHVG